MIKQATLDTGALVKIDEILKVAKSQGIDLITPTVSIRENKDRKILPSVGIEAEQAVYGESRYGEGVSASNSDHLEQILAIISNGSFPKDRAKLSEGYRHMLRDAMIFEVHVRSGADVFVTTDSKGFIKHGKREKLESLFETKILLVDEFLKL